MQKLIGPGIVIAVIITACVICANTAGGLLDQSSHTMDSMALVKSMDVMQSQSNNIQSLINQSTLQTIGMVIIVLAGLVVIWQFVRVSKFGNGGGHWIPAWPSAPHQVEPGGNPQYVSLNYPRAADYIRRLNDAQAQHMLNALYPIVSLLEQRLGIYTTMPVDRQENRLPAPRRGFLSRRAEVESVGKLVRKEPEIPDVKWGD